MNEYQGVTSLSENFAKNKLNEVTSILSFAPTHEHNLYRDLDEVNYLSIILLEHLGCASPTESLINKVEHFIKKLLKQL